MWDGHYKTTFKKDFTIAESYGQEALRETYKRAFNEWKDNVEYLTELILVINHKSWDWYNKNNQPMSEFYANLYNEADAAAIHYLEENHPEDLHYYFNTLD